MGQDNHQKVFTVDARAILTLGRDSIKDHTTALAELVKNSYDADATMVEVEIHTKSKPAFIRVADNGSGMTEDDVDKRWLRIGYSEKVTDKVSTRKRRKTGEKGIGRISADRLGSVLELRTKASDRPFALRVNWDDFNVKGKDISTIPIRVIEKPNLTLPVDEKRPEIDTGTELIIEGLRQDWMEDDIRNLHRELSMLVSPFRTMSDFTITLLNDITEAYNGKVESEVNENSLLTLAGSFDGEEKLTYTIQDRDAKGKPKPQVALWNELSQSKRPAKPRCGAVSVTLMFFPQKKANIRGGKFSLSEIKEYVRENYGVRIYRDEIWVKPYGNPEATEGDWLDLGGRVASNPAGPGRRDFRMGPKQLVGAVFVSRDNNEKLIDSASREGLVHGNAFYDLRRLVLGCVNLLEARYHQKFKEEKDKARKGVRPTEEVKELSRELTVLKRDLRHIAPMLSKVAEHNVSLALDKVNSVVEKIQETQKSISELQSQASIYRGLATIGIAASVFGHETQTSISNFVGATYNASRLLRKPSPDIIQALEQIESAKEYADQVSAWGAFALTRVQRDKRTRQKHPIHQLADDLIQEIKPAMTALNISVGKKLNPVEGRFFAMDLEAILLNLLTNAYFACQQKNRKRAICVLLHPKKEDGVEGFELVVSDTGPGVPKQFIERIWEPLFTGKTNEQGKQVGTGLGLAIVQSIVDELGGVRRVNTDPELKGARFTVWLPLYAR